MPPARSFPGMTPGQFRFFRIRSILYTLRFAVIASVLLVLATYGFIHL
jgi:hypothetical protein